MKLNEKVSNPLLVGAIQLMKAEDTPEHQKLFMQELVKAHFLMPVRFEESWDSPTGAAADEPLDKSLDEPADKSPDTAAEEARSRRLRFPALSGKDGQRFLIAYTDRAAMNTRDADGKETTPAEFRENTAALSFEELAGMILARSPEGIPTPYVGFVLNPSGENVIVGRDQVAFLMQQRIRSVVQSVGARRQTPPLNLR